MAFKIFFAGPSGWPNPSLLPGLSRWSVCSRFPSGSLSPRRRFPSFRPRTCQRSGQSAASRSWIEPARFAASELEAGKVQLVDHGSSPLDSLPANKAGCDSLSIMARARSIRLRTRQDVTASSSRSWLEPARFAASEQGKMCSFSIMARARSTRSHPSHGYPAGPVRAVYYQLGCR
jgi:hypothetical protein